MGTKWNDFKNEIELNDEERSMIDLELSLINAVIAARESKGLTQKELSVLCGVKQPVIARLESSTHSPQINSLLRVLKPLGYTLAVVPEKDIKSIKTETSMTEN